TGALLLEGMVNGLAIGTTDQIATLGTGVTAQITIQGTGAGLAVSTAVLAFSGDGHDYPSYTNGYGVVYSSNAGQRWVDYSSAPAVLNVGLSLSAMAVYNGQIVVADSGNGKLYYSFDGVAWTGANSNAPIQGSANLKALAVFNGKLFAADGVSGKVYFATNINTGWATSNAGQS